MSQRPQPGRVPQLASRGVAPTSRVEARDAGISVEYDHESSYPDEEIGFHLGQRVRHSTYGEGEVRGVTGYGRDLKLTVYFASVGPKTIVARFVEAL